MNIVTATKSNNTITVLVDENGTIRPIPVTSEHPKWTAILTAWGKQDFEELLELMSMERIVKRFSNGDLVVSDNGVFYKDVPLVGIDVDRIMAFLRQNEPYAPIANYMVLKLKNPSKRAISEMYNFLEHKQMPLSPSGTILAYKGVQKDFFSVSSGHEPLLQGRRNEAGQIFNGVGEVIEMNRSDVDDDFRRGCSGGLHAGSLAYARDWARQHNGIIIVIEIDPANVVSVPEDCNCMKLRCSKYKVLGLYNGPLPDTYTAEFSSEIDPENNDSEDTDLDNEEEEWTDEWTDENEDTSGEDPLAHVQPTVSPETNNVNNVVEPPQTKETVRSQLGLDEKGDEIRQKFVAEVCTILGLSPDDITDDKEFIVDLGADSLDIVELIMAMEETFGVEISDELAEKADTVGAAIEIIRGLLNPIVTTPEENLPSILKTAEQNEPDADTYQKVQESPVASPATLDFYNDGYKLGLRNGVRRRKRLYYVVDEYTNNMAPHPLDFIRGYNDGYRNGRKDYKH